MTVVCRSEMSIVKAATLNVPRPPRMVVFDPISTFQSSSSSQESRPLKVARSSGVQTGTFSGSLMPPRRKPLETWALSCVFSVASKLAMKRGAMPSALVSPSVGPGSANRPSKTWLRVSS